MGGKIVAFYNGYHGDAKGRTIDELWTWSNQQLEESHDFVQWLFPLRNRSNFGADAPLLEDGDVNAFLVNEDLRTSLLKSLDLMLRFYGLRRAGQRIEQTDDWPERSTRWLTTGNHNFMRITRILKSLSILGLGEHAAALFDELQRVFESGHADVIGSETYKHWSDAGSRQCRP